VRQGEVRDFESAKRKKNDCAPWHDKVEVVDTVGRSGSHSAALRASAPHHKKDTKTRRFTQLINILPVMEYGVEYELEAWVKVEGADGCARFRVLPPHMDKKYWRGPRLKPIDGESVQASDQWQKIWLRFRNHDWHGWSLKPTIYAELPPGGVAYIDDLRVRKVR
jgi:hypothetical protein